ncbi:MAG: MBOAT family O-acyltransferase [Prosthecobacter sp.]
MIFNTFSYFALFLLPAAILFRVVPQAWKAWVIIASGAAFFVYFSITTVGGVLGAWCLGLILWEAVTSRLYRPASRWCLFGILQALLILIVFKYWNFICSLVAGSSWRWAGMFLPLGISFFTFEFIHYAADRRAGKTEAGSFSEYLAFLLFFPTMVAGPIKRFQDFIPALRAPSASWAADFERGITRILCGLVKKFAFADVLTSFTVHLNAADIMVAQRWVLPLWLMAYALQIYLDFSSYSDIAIGSARLFGLNVKENFDWPYLRTNLSEFWRHWHMSLTKWLTDYVFIPLGGSRSGRLGVYGNVLVTMIISGLWHGAGLNFIVWGLWHGCGLVVQRAWTCTFPKANPSRARSMGSWLLTMAFVCAGWSFFIMDLPTAMLFFHKLFIG